MTDSHTCLACGYTGLTEPPRSLSGGGSYEICYSCGFEYGVTDDDLGYTYESWRDRWVGQGMPWTSAGLEDPPMDWNPERQLAALLEGGDGQA